MLVCDWFANRLYFPLTINLTYCLVIYSLAMLSLMIRHDVEEIYRLPELKYFELFDDRIAWLLPLFVMISVYIMTRFKHFYIGEGDLVFDFDAWAKSAANRMDDIEKEDVHI